MERVAPLAEEPFQCLLLPQVEHAAVREASGARALLEGNEQQAAGGECVEQAAEEPRHLRRLQVDQRTDAENGLAGVGGHIQEREVRLEHRAVRVLPGEHRQRPGPLHP